MITKKHNFNRIIWDVVAIILLAGVFHFSTLSADARTRAHTASPEEILMELNEIRGAYGYGSLTCNPDLSDCAAVRSVEISYYFSHTRPDGEAWYTVNSGIMFGENLLRTKRNHEADDIVEMWMNSPAHRELILDGSYRTIGIARYHVGETDYWVLEFGYF